MGYFIKTALSAINKNKNVIKSVLRLCTWKKKRGNFITV